MADFSAIRDGIRDRLATISGLRVHTWYPEAINPPAAIVEPERWDYHQTMGSPGLSHAVFTVLLLAAPLQRSTYARAQDTLDTYLDDSGASSVKAAIEGDLTLGGTVTTLRVTGVSDYGVTELGGIDYVGARVRVEVWP